MGVVEGETEPRLPQVRVSAQQQAGGRLASDSMFNGSSNVEILIPSSNFLRHVPKHLPPASANCTSRWEGEGRGGALSGRGEPRHSHGHSSWRLRGLGTSWGHRNPLQRRRQRPRHLAVSPTLSPLGLGLSPWLPQTPSPYLISRLCPCPLAIPHALSHPPISQNNKLEKIPPGAFSELSNLRAWSCTCRTTT